MRTPARASSSEHAAASNRSAASSSSSLALDRQQRTAGPAGSSPRALAVEPEPARPALAPPAALLEVGDPLAAAVGALHAGDEARHHGLQLGEDHVGVVARLGQRRRVQAQQQLLVGLAAGEDAHVRQRGGRQQPAQQVERLGLDRAPVRRLGLVGARGKRSSAHAITRGSASRIGVEQEVHRPLVLGAELGVAPVAVAEALGHRRVVGDVARRLLEVGGEPAALEQLRHHVRDPLAGDVRAAELRHRVVAVAEEDALVELAGALALLAVERRRRLRRRRRTRRGTSAAASPGSASSARTSRP